MDLIAAAVVVRAFFISSLLFARLFLHRAASLALYLELGLIYNFAKMTFTISDSSDSTYLPNKEYYVNTYLLY